MNLIVCSVPDTIPDEQQLIQELFLYGLATFHLRKPTFSIEELRRPAHRCNSLENISPLRAAGFDRLHEKKSIDDQYFRTRSGRNQSSAERI